MSTIYTIGHSTRSLDELVAALRAHGVAALVDIRAFPMSRRLPHFNRESLQRELSWHDIEYVWMGELRGHRKKIRDDSPNTGLRNESFRNYADYMLTPQFADAIDNLLFFADRTAALHEDVMLPDSGLPASGRSAETGRTASQSETGGAGTAIMCAEPLYFQCHRMLVSDYLTAHEHAVLHIQDDKHPARPHRITAEAHLVNGQLLYNAQELF